MPPVTRIGSKTVPLCDRARVFGAAHRERDRTPGRLARFPTRRLAFGVPLIGFDLTRGSRPSAAWALRRPFVAATIQSYRRARAVALTDRSPTSGESTCQDSRDVPGSTIGRRPMKQPDHPKPPEHERARSGAAIRRERGDESEFAGEIRERQRGEPPMVQGPEELTCANSPPRRAPRLPDRRGRPS